ncbi:MAG: TonB-dependent receptor, partial [Chitinophagaceae bacterium]|nr:TonB-dependent receptor [Chitinophagaceae bacterium]
MIKLTASLLLAMCCSLAALSQNATIKGRITDTAEKKNLTNSVVAVLRAGDSTLVKFARSTKDGSFSLSKLPAGDYLFLVTHPTYADYYSRVKVNDTSVLSLDEVPMILRSQLLEQVVVSQKLGAIRIKKDTTEYIADSFKVAANANVEELLKRLPGIQVDVDGKIKTQGEDVQKVLVDGEEFFGDDPTMATQNIRADAVEKVQVFDKKSDQATFTGIDDGQRTKTINLKLKEDKKNGYFGKVKLGGGLKDKFDNQFMANAFKGKRKFAVYGIMSNTGRTGLGWGERNAYGGGESNMVMDEDMGGIMFFSEGDDFGGGGGSYYGEGLPTSWSAGTHYSNKFDGDRHKINFNYRFNKLNTIGGGSTITEYLLKDSSYYRTENGNQFNQRLRNNLSGSYEVQLDSSSSIKVTANGTLTKNSSFSNNSLQTLTGKSLLVNQLQRNNSSESESQALNTTMLYRKRFKKAGRTISFNFDQRYNNSESTGFLKSFNEEFGVVPRKDTTDQQKINNSNRLSMNGKVSYTEPLSKAVTLEANYSLGTNDNQSERLSFDESNGKYDVFVDSLSTHFKVNILTNSGGLNLRVNKKLINFSVGGNVSHSAFDQEDLFTDTTRKYEYLNLFPRASFNWSIKPQTRLSIRYNGSTRQPTIDQLQPLKDNSD